MEERNEQHVHEQNDDDSGTWVLITPGVSRVIGRVWGLDLTPISELYTNKSGEVPVDAVLQAGIVTLMPTYDFFAPLRPIQVPGPDGKPVAGMTRDPLITARDFTCKPYKTHIKSGPGVLFDFFSQMEAEDRKTYQDFVKQAREHAKAKYEQMQGPPRIALANEAESTAIARAHGRRG